MRTWIGIVVGILCFLLGGLWFLQGIGVVGGSFMTGSRLWLFIGLVVLIAGLTLIYNSARRLRRR
ncbi:hypothetical protein [Pseudonocardia spinosispora]|uniref:hypothetical protein n=1 Tax=Pseudonocardia spinosispora TaxID=103441 RepID=UPI000410E402|nr:hypothetical protein [Pseudonocardia spinosispora]